MKAGAGSDQTTKPSGPVRRNRLPSLRSLRTFEVVGRVLNMQTAADILCITVSAVSHQIRNLEADLNVQLFRRTGRGVELTADGNALLPGLTLIFEQLGATLDSFRRRAGPQIVTISMSASFAMRWFLGRLGKFYDLNPNIEVHVATHIGREVQRDPNVDCFIHVGNNDWPELEGDQLMVESLHLACSPSLLRKPEQSVTNPEDVFKNRILKADDRAEDWPLWLQAQNLKLPAQQRTLSFQSHVLTMQAAIEGLGVMLTDPVEIAEELQFGRLVMPLDRRMAVVSRGYYFYAMADSNNSEAIEKLRSWLHSELNTSS